MSLCPSNQLKTPISVFIEIETVFELTTNAKSMVIKPFHNTVGVWLFFFETLFVIAGKERHISNNIQKIYSLFAGA